MSATKFKIIGKSIKPYLGEGSLSQGIGSLPLWKHIESRLADELTWRCTIEQTMPWVFIDRWSGIEVECDRDDEVCGFYQISGRIDMTSRAKSLLNLGQDNGPLGSTS